MVDGKPAVVNFFWQVITKGIAEIVPAEILVEPVVEAEPVDE
jgi:hypothetical protein